jgi:hypothetical protein
MFINFLVIIQRFCLNYIIRWRRLGDKLFLRRGNFGFGFGEIALEIRSGFNSRTLARGLARGSTAIAANYMKVTSRMMLRLSS